MLPLQFTPPATPEIPADSVILNKLEQNVDRLTHMSWHDLLNTFIDWIIKFGLRLIAAVVLFIACRWLIKKIDVALDRLFERRSVDSSVNTFIRNMLRIAAYLVLIMVVINILGIKTTSFIAILASAGFAVGMALSGTLQNFAGGVMILLLKPFRTGDSIQAQGQEGTVKEIKLFNTVLITPDNKTIIIPNGGMSSAIINNASETGTRRVEWIFIMSYGDDYNKAKGLIKELFDADDRILRKPPYYIALHSLNYTTVNIVARAWTKSSDYWDVFFEMNEKVYKIFPEHGLAIPTNNMNVNLSTIDPDKPVPTPIPTTDIKSIKCGSGTRSDENSITKDDLDFPNDASTAKKDKAPDRADAGAQAAKPDPQSRQ